MRSPAAQVIDPREHPNHGRFARAVGADQCDSRAAFDVKADAAIYGEFAVAFDSVAQFDDAPRAAIAIWKFDGRRPLESQRRLQPFDLFELLDAALDQLGFARLVTEAADERLHVLDFDALLFVCGQIRLKAAFALDQVERVIAVVLTQRAARDFHRAACDPIEKIMIMRDQDDPAFVILQVFFEPVARLDIQMVGRLVEHQEVGPLQEQFGQCDAHPDTARELGDVALQILFAKSQAKQYRRRAAVGIVEAVPFEFAEHVAQFLQRSVVIRSRMVGRENLFEFHPPPIMLAHLG